MEAIYLIPTPGISYDAF